MKNYKSVKYKLLLFVITLFTISGIDFSYVAFANENESTVMSTSIQEMQVNDENSNVDENNNNNNQIETSEVEKTSIQSVTNKTAETFSKSSNEMINVPTTWETVGKGEGTVVAIIDSGIDINHDVFKLTNINTAKYKSADDINQLKAKYGISYGEWINEKIVFAYNYVEASNNLKEQKEASHGTHVSGIAVGNPSKTDVIGQKVYGVAPEAQLMFMRVFADSGGTTPVLYVKAIEDAVKLGADVINLSLGSAAGSLVDVGNALTKAIEDAKKKGVTVVVAAGNDTVWGEGQSKPLAENPDYGVVASPATAKDSIAVASINNTHIVKETFKVVGMPENDLFKDGMGTYKLPNDGKAFSPNKQYEYVYVGLGKESDYVGKDLQGKIALIKRGEISFSEKIIRAKDHKAIGVIVFNNTTVGDDLSMALGSGQEAIKARSIPAVFIPKNMGEALVEAQDENYKILFNNLKAIYDNPEANEMSEFTSWGLSSDGELKPDVTAPGGSIYSSINNNKYATMSGTSMASPHVAGAMAIIQQALKNKYPNLSPEQIVELSKHLLMSSANPFFDKTTNAYASPRQQGSGVIDVLKTINSSIYLTGLDDYSSISLGNVNDVLSFDINIHNLLNEEQRFKYVVDLITDEVKDGKFTLKSKALDTILGEEIVLLPNTTKTLRINIDVSKYSADLIKLMPNGYYLEGFVRILNIVDDAEVSSIPFSGFKGEFQNLPVVEKPIYEFGKDEKPFYTPNNFNSETDIVVNDDNIYFTALISNKAEFNHETGDYGRQTPVVLGSFENENGQFYIKKGADGQPIFAISPNGDGNRDIVSFQGVFLRNFKNLKATVYSATDVNLSNPLWKSKTYNGEKNHYANNPQKPRAHFFEETAWEGKDSFNRDLPDGLYKYVVTFEPTVYGGEVQKLEFNILVNRSRPAVTTAIIDVNDEGYLTFKPRPSLAYGLPIYRERVYYVIPTKDELGQPISIENPNLKDATGKPQKEQLTEARRIYLTPDANGVYTLPTESIIGKPLDIVDFYFSVEDEAGNTTSGNLYEFLQVGSDIGIVNIITVDEKTGILKDMGYNFIVRDSSGNVVVPQAGLEQGTFTRLLPFGEYTVELILMDKDVARLANGESHIKSFKIDETNTLSEVEFKVTPVVQQLVTINFTGDVPSGARVYLVNENGDEIEIPRAKYANNVQFSKLVNEDNYRVKVVMSDQYVVVNEEPSVVVSSENANVVSLEIAEKPIVTSKGNGATYFDQGEMLPKAIIEEIEIPFDTQVVYDNTLIEGATEVVRAGQNGADVYVTILDVKTFVKHVDKIDQILTIGTKKAPIRLTENNTDDSTPTTEQMTHTNGNVVTNNNTNQLVASKPNVVRNTSRAVGNEVSVSVVKQDETSSAVNTTSIVESSTQSIPVESTTKETATTVSTVEQKEQTSSDYTIIFVMLVLGLLLLLFILFKKRKEQQ